TRRDLDPQHAVGDAVGPGALGDPGPDQLAPLGDDAPGADLIGDAMELERGGDRGRCGLRAERARRAPGAGFAGLARLTRSTRRHEARSRRISSRSRPSPPPPPPTDP